MRTTIHAGGTRGVLLLFLAVMAGAAGLIPGSRAGTLYVAPAGTNDAAGKYPDWAGAATDIQSAVSAAVHGDTVLVTNATYTLSSNIVVTNGIWLRSWQDGALAPSNTVLNGNGEARCLYVNHTNALISGFTLTNGNGVGSINTNFGGGAYLGGGSTYGGVLSNCIIAGNTANKSGGGVYARGSACRVEDCRITGNVTLTNATSEGGGGAVVHYGAIRNTTLEFNAAASQYAYYTGGGGLLLDLGAVAENCRIISNTAYTAGGGVFLGGTGCILRDSTVSGNRQTGAWTGWAMGGGIYAYVTVNALIQGCTIADNEGQRGGGIAMRFQSSSQGMIISNCVFRGNQATRFNAGIYSQISEPGYTPTNFLYDTTVESNLTLNDDGPTVMLARGAVVDRCIIRNNRVKSGLAAGIHFDGASNKLTVIRNCLIAGNTNLAASGAGGMNLPTNTTVENCTVAHNQGYTGGLYIRGSQIAISNTICIFNTGAGASNWSALAGAEYAFDYGCTMPTNGLAGAANREAEPLFLDPAASDYRLPAMSPCVNAGMNAAWMAAARDLDGVPRIDRFSRRVDMGAYEHRPAGTLYNSR